MWLLQNTNKKTGQRGRMATRSGQNVTEAEKLTSSIYLDNQARQAHTVTTKREQEVIDYLSFSVIVRIA